MAIQTRRGNKENFEPDRLQPGEIATALNTGEVFMRVGGGVISLVSPGEVKEITYDTADPGWLLCQGQAVSRTTYAALFAKIGTKYGSGDGSTTFNLPDARGKVTVGLDPRDSDFSALGKTDGHKSETLTANEIPPLNIAVSGSLLMFNRGNGGGPAVEAGSYGNYGNNSPYHIDGFGNAFSLMNPYVVVNYEIYTGVFNN